MFLRGAFLQFKFYCAADLRRLPLGAAAERQKNVEMTAREVNFIITGAFHPDAAAMRFDDAARERQSQPRAAALKAVPARRAFLQVARLTDGV